MIKRGIGLAVGAVALAGLCATGVALAGGGGSAAPQPVPSPSAALPTTTPSPTRSPSASPSPSPSTSPSASVSASASRSAVHRAAAPPHATRPVDLHTMKPHRPGPGQVSTSPQNGDCKQINGVLVCGTTKTGVPVPPR